jgi:uncharacterized membrane protein (Fun14 family)
MDLQPFLPFLIAILSGVVSVVGLILGYAVKVVGKCAGLLKDILVKVSIIEKEVARIDGIEAFMLASTSDRKDLRLTVEDHSRRLALHDSRLAELEKK